MQHLLCLLVALWQKCACANTIAAYHTCELVHLPLLTGLKRHSVTLFEGGRVSGDDVMSELITELWVSYQAGQGFEGDMLKLTNYAAALATCLETVRDAGGSRGLELLRKESLAGKAECLFTAFWVASSS